MSEKDNLSADVTTESKSGELASIDATLIKMSNVDLDRCVILRSDQSVSCGAAFT